LAFLKIKEFTFVSDCFQKGRNAEIGLFGQALNNHVKHYPFLIRTFIIAGFCIKDKFALNKNTGELVWYYLVSARKLPFFQVLESKSSISRLGLSENQGVPILGMTVFRKGVTQKLGFSGKHYLLLFQKRQDRFFIGA
jgi:hypothetical protein